MTENTSRERGSLAEDREHRGCSEETKAVTHASLPWQVSIDGEVITAPDSVIGNIVCEGPLGRSRSMAYWPANAAFIVTAVNAHAELVVALRGLVPFLDDLDDATIDIGVYPDVTCTERCRAAVKSARDVLRKLEREPDPRGNSESNPRQHP